MTPIEDSSARPSVRGPTKSSPMRRRCSRRPAASVLFFSPTVAVRKEERPRAGLAELGRTGRLSDHGRRRDCRLRRHLRRPLRSLFPSPLLR